MQLNLDRLVGGRLWERFQIGADDPVLAAYEPEVREPLSLAVELVHPSHGTYVMTAQLRGTVFAPCRLCLQPVAIEMDDRFRVVYQESGARPDRIGGRRKLEGTDDPELVLFPAGATRIEIGREIRDRLFLETDGYPQCDEECRGLCPICGRDLNEGDCGCEVPATDSRWNGLRELGTGATLHGNPTSRRYHGGTEEKNQQDTAAQATYAQEGGRADSREVR
ncbi:MAG TPA: DUF177 domain-containing protein [Gemmatimonadota bacterium]|nr:DUF177 domain-containing protein [Gemmatimonadota bacterium]